MLQNVYLKSLSVTSKETIFIIQWVFLSSRRRDHVLNKNVNKTMVTTTVNAPK